MEIMYSIATRILAGEPQTHDPRAAITPCRYPARPLATTVADKAASRNFSRLQFSVTSHPPATATRPRSRAPPTTISRRDTLLSTADAVLYARNPQMALVPKQEDNEDRIIKPQLSAPAVDYSKFPYVHKSAKHRPAMADTRLQLVSS